MNKFKVGDIVGVAGEARTRKVNRVERDTVVDYLLDDGKWYNENKLVHPLKYKVGDKVNFDGKTHEIKAVIHGLRYPYFLSDGHWYDEQEIAPTYKELKDIPIDKLPGHTVYEKSTGEAALVTSVLIKPNVTHVSLKFVDVRDKVTYPIFCGRYKTEEPPTPLKVGDTLDSVYYGKLVVLAIDKDWVWCTGKHHGHLTMSITNARDAKKAWKEKNK